VRSRTYPCPQCGNPAALGAENHWRPFCSQRCKLIDLGEWASGSYAISAEEQSAPPSDVDDTAERH
jgi:uncharacterized protein